MGRLKQTSSTLVSDLTRREGDGSSSDSLERNVRMNVYHGIASIMALSLAVPFIGIFAVRIGASDFQVGLLSSGPALVSLLSMIPGGRFMDGQSRKRRMVARFIFLHRLFYVFIASIPFFTVDRRAWLLVFAIAIMNVPASIANIGWQAFISQVVPVARRADAFAARNRLMNLAGTVVVLITGRLIDILGFPVGYQVTFAGAFVLSLVEIWVLGRVEETPNGASQNHVSGAEIAAAARTAGSFSGLGNALRDVAGERRFVRYTLASVVFYLCWQAPWPLFTLYQVKVLGANNTWVSLLNLTNTGGSLIGYGFWARKINQYGNLRTLFLSSVGIFIVPVAYALSRSLLTVAGFNLLTGAIFSGVNLALFNQLLEVTPQTNKATYIAYYTTAVNAAAIFAPMLGVSLLGLFGYFWAFMACAGLRLAGSFVFLLVSHMDRKGDGDNVGGSRRNRGRSQGRALR